MIKNVEGISSLEFNKGLVTRSDFLKGDINASPNTMDVQWQFDASLHKRLGSSSVNSVIITQTGNFSSWILDKNGSLTTNLVHYWTLNELSDNRLDTLGSSNLSTNGTMNSVGGVRGNAVQSADTGGNNYLQTGTNDGSLSFPGSNLTLSAWIYYTGTATGTNYMFLKNNEYFLSNNNTSIFFNVTTGGGGTKQISVPLVSVNTWHNIIAVVSNGSYIGLATDGVLVLTAPLTQSITNGTTVLRISQGPSDTTPGNPSVGPFRQDESSIWTKVLSSSEMLDIYGGGTGNTYSTGTTNLSSWYSFDFGATGIRWYTVCVGTGIVASSNGGSTFVNVTTSRTQAYQYLDRSKNVLIATSDAYDVPLYWAGSAGTFAATLSAGSAPQSKFSINYNGFLILLNAIGRPRGFYYADENLQLTDPYNNNFDLPSSVDDEVTAAFRLYKFMYVSTRYRIFRVAFVGGNPDWSYLEVKQWGYVPRTVKVVTLQNGGQVAIGMDWDRRLRMFDGFEDRIISDNIENNNLLCDFAIQKVSYAGSGLTISNAEYDSIQQEYRLNVAIGASSTQTTHAIILNLRTLAFYPYQNQQWNTTCIIESNNQRRLMAVDRSGFCYILNSGNLDKGVTPINDVYDLPPLFSKTPEAVSKGKQINFFFGPASCGTIFIQDRVDLSNQWSPMVPLSDAKGNTQITGSENLIKVLRTYNIPSTFNTWQGRITSSASTANPWQLDRLDFLQQGFGIGRGNNS